MNPFDQEPPESVGPRWETWLARFDNYLIAANITEDERQRAQLLHGGGEDVFDVYLTFDSSSITSYNDLKDALTAHFSPKRNREYEIYLFRLEKQSQSETLDSYVIRLKRLGKHCQFADMDTELKSQVIQHCVLSKVREKAFMESSMSLADLLTYARSVEVTMLSVAAMLGPAASASLNIPKSIRWRGDTHQVVTSPVLPVRPFANVADAGEMARQPLGLPSMGQDVHVLQQVESFRKGMPDEGCASVFGAESP